MSVPLLLLLRPNENTTKLVRTCHLASLLTGSRVAGEVYY